MIGVAPSPRPRATAQDDRKRRRLQRLQPLRPRIPPHGARQRRSAGCEPRAGTSYIYRRSPSSPLSSYSPPQRPLGLHTCRSAPAPSQQRGQNRAQPGRPVSLPAGGGWTKPTAGVLASTALGVPPPLLHLSENSPPPSPWPSPPPLPPSPPPPLAGGVARGGVPVAPPPPVSPLPLLVAMLHPRLPSLPALEPRGAEPNSELGGSSPPPLPPPSPPSPPPLRSEMSLTLCCRTAAFHA